MNGVIEIWKPIVSQECQVSNFGRVRRMNSGQILRGYQDRDGYVFVLGRRLHHFVLETFVGKKLGSNFQCNHIDGIKTNNTVENLEWVTAKENVQHAWRLGLIKPVVHSAETRLMLGLMKRGKKLTKEHCRKLSQAKRGKSSRWSTGRK